MKFTKSKIGTFTEMCIDYLHETGNFFPGKEFCDDSKYSFGDHINRYLWLLCEQPNNDMSLYLFDMYIDYINKNKHDHLFQENFDWYIWLIHQDTLYHHTIRIFPYEFPYKTFIDDLYGTYEKYIQDIKDSFEKNILRNIKSEEANMNNEKCSICGKAMGNSLQVDDEGIPTHKKCLKTGENNG